MFQSFFLVISPSKEANSGETKFKFQGETDVDADVDAVEEVEVEVNLGESLYDRIWSSIMHLWKFRIPPARGTNQFEGDYTLSNC